MGRIRTIKPEFFLSEGLATLSPLHRLLFVGLWTLADREGRLEDRPQRIKVQLLPWDNCDPEKLLRDLDREGYIHRYEAVGIACIAIPGFQKHQRPHPKEAAWGLPNPPSREVPRKAVKRSVESSVGSRVASRGEGKEILESGKEILDPALRAAAGASPSAPPVQNGASGFGEAPTYKATDAVQPDPADGPPSWKALVADLFAAFEAARGVAYDPSGKDWKVLKGLVRHGHAEVVRRWKIGLSARYAARCSTFWDLGQRWNACATPEAPAGSQGGSRGNFGPATEAQKDWSKPDSTPTRWDEELGMEVYTK